MQIKTFQPEKFYDMTIEYLMEKDPNVFLKHEIMDAGVKENEKTNKYMESFRSK